MLENNIFFFMKLVKCSYDFKLDVKKNFYLMFVLWK